MRSSSEPELRRIGQLCCLAISAWGQHSETNQKFWIERETTGIKIGYGLKPLHSVRPDHIVDLSAEVAAALA